MLPKLVYIDMRNVSAWINRWKYYVISILLCSMFDIEAGLEILFILKTEVKTDIGVGGGKKVNNIIVATIDKCYHCIKVCLANPRRA
jgi:hypothetical protein